VIRTLGEVRKLKKQPFKNSKFYLKVCAPCVVTFINWTLIMFEWYMARFVGNQTNIKQTCVRNENEVCAPIIDAILGLVVKCDWGLRHLCDQLKVVSGEIFEHNQLRS